MSEEIISTYQADPEWDYYEISLSLTNLNNKISEGLKLISEQEKASRQVDQKLREILEPHTEVLDDIVDELSLLEQYFHE